MEIIYQPRFINSFNQIWDYISKDSKNRANKFKKELRQSIEDLEAMPFKYRKSIYFEDENIRDLIFKGYIVVYKVNQDDNQIMIIGINKYKNSL